MTTWEDIVKANGTIKTTPVKGKNYAEVNQRIKAFRMNHPLGCITTDIIGHADGVIIMTAMVKDEEGRILGTGTAYEREGSSNINKTSYIENCETSAVGRALAMCGYGIDVSIASAEEIGNAIEAQDILFAPVKPADIAALKAMADKKGVKVETVARAYKLDKLEDMTFEQFQSAMRRLDKTEVKNGN